MLKIDIPYAVVGIDLPDESVRHLSNLGLKSWCFVKSCFKKNAKRVQLYA